MDKLEIIRYLIKKARIVAALRMAGLIEIKISKNRDEGKICSP